MITIVSARREELAALLRLSAWRLRRAPDGMIAYQRRDHAVSVLLTGAGRERTERAMALLLADEPPDAILTLGFAGACSANLDVGDLVLANRIHYIEGKPFDWDAGSLEQGDGPYGEIVADAGLLERARAAVEVNGIDYTPASTITVDSLVRTSELAAWLGEMYGVSAVDRESYWIAAAAAAAGVPCLSVRAIAYGLDETLPKVAFELPDSPSGGRMGPTLKYGIRDPLGLWRQMRAFSVARIAVAALAEALTRDERPLRRSA